jgi:hypothetical protein
MITITELLGRAKRAIETGENSLHDAAEDIAAAREQGATQRQIAEAVGKSAAWVNQLLKWRPSGYQDNTTPKISVSLRNASPSSKTSRPSGLLGRCPAPAALNRNDDVQLANQHKRHGDTWRHVVTCR